ncbi:unnamed protein product [Linum trigynum]|uniref:Transposase (putative) gypsy type domain-containing protein n=2 Tax=Linum trigynum TaxID=586398 RepID=A0AAV2CZH7_9ROSI
MPLRSVPCSEPVRGRGEQLVPGEGSFASNRRDTPIFSIRPWHGMFHSTSHFSEWAMIGPGGRFNRNESWVQSTLLQFDMPRHWEYAVPTRYTTPGNRGVGWHAVYRASLDYGLRLPFPTWLCDVMRRSHLTLSTVTPGFWTLVAAFRLGCHRAGVSPSVELFYACFYLRGEATGWSLHSRSNALGLVTPYGRADRGWEREFFYFFPASGELSSEGVMIPTEWRDIELEGLHRQAVRGEYVVQRDLAAKVKRISEGGRINVETPEARAILFFTVYNDAYSHFRACMEIQENSLFTARLPPPAPRPQSGVVIREISEEPEPAMTTSIGGQNKRVRRSSPYRGKNYDSRRKFEASSSSHSARGGEHSRFQKARAYHNSESHRQGGQGTPGRGRTDVPLVMNYQTLRDIGNQFPPLEGEAAGVSFALSQNQMNQYAAEMERRVARAREEVMTAQQNVVRVEHDLRNQTRKVEEAKGRANEVEALLREVRNRQMITSERLQELEASGAALLQEMTRLKEDHAAEHEVLMAERDEARAETVRLQHQVQQSVGETSGGAMLLVGSRDIFPEAESDEARVPREADTRIEGVPSEEVVMHRDNLEIEPFISTPIFDTASADQSFIAAMDSPIPSELAMSAENAWVNEILGFGPPM